MSSLINFAFSSYTVLYRNVSFQGCLGISPHILEVEQIRCFTLRNCVKCSGSAGQDSNKHSRGPAELRIRAQLIISSSKERVWERKGKREPGIVRRITRLTFQLLAWWWQMDPEMDLWMRRVTGTRAHEVLSSFHRSCNPKQGDIKLKHYFSLSVATEEYQQRNLSKVKRNCGLSFLLHFWFRVTYCFLSVCTSSS